MPFRSRAQQKKMYAMMDRGELNPAVVKEFQDATPKGKKLPEHVKKKKK